MAAEPASVCRSMRLIRSWTAGILARRRQSEGKRSHTCSGSSCPQASQRQLFRHLLFNTHARTHTHAHTHTHTRSHSLTHHTPHTHTHTHSLTHTHTHPHTHTHTHHTHTHTNTHTLAHTHSVASDWSDQHWIVLRAGASRFSFCL